MIRPKGLYLFISLIGVAAVLSIALVAGNAEATVVTINAADLDAYARGSSGTEATQNFSGTTIPTSTTANAVVGNTHSNNTINWSVTGSQTILSFDMDHRRLGTNGSTAGTHPSHTVILKFTANADVPYTLSGYYNVTDVAASGTVKQQITFDDGTANVSLFGNSQLSLNTTNEQFVVGGSGGDTSNSLSGSLTGDLIAGHVYILNFSYFIFATPDDDSGSSALGNATLRIGPSSADFNGNGIVDAADYVLWRKNNWPADEYNLWRAHFGQLISGSGSSVQSTSVPEAPTIRLLGMGAISLLGYRRTKNGRSTLLPLATADQKCFPSD